MAGLLDIFGSSGGQTLGLLGMSPSDIQSSRDDAQAQALYGLAARLFQGGNTGQSIAEGLQQGQKAYRSAMDTQLQDKLQGFQLEEVLRKRKLEQDALARQNLINRAVAGAYQPTIAATPAQYYGQETTMPLMDDDGNMQPGATAPVAGRAAGLDLATLAPILMASQEGRKTLGELVASQKAFRPEYKEVGGVLYEIPTFEGPIKPVAGTKKRNTVTVGNVVLDQDTMDVLYTAPDAPSGSIKEFQDFTKLSPEAKKAYLALQENKRPVTNVNMPGEGERKAATLASRLNFSVGQMNEAIGLDPNAAMPSTASEIARFVSRTEFLPNQLNSTQRQVVEAAQEDVLDAALTLSTGAAYTREQLSGYKKSYFPQIGDEAETVKTKQARLMNLLKSAEIASGRAVNQITTPVPRAATPSGLPSQSAIDAEIARRKEKK
jgi:hypothetical protein